MDLVVSAVLPIFALILCGFVAARTGLLAPAATDSLNRFVVWLALPALLFQVMAEARAGDLDHWPFIAAFGGGMMLTYAISFATSGQADRRLADAGIDGLGAAYGNTGFLGIPLGLALFGPVAGPAVVLATLLTMCVVFPISIVLIEADLHPGGHWGRIAATVGRSLARNPLLVAPLAGALFAATGLPLPAAAHRFTSLLGAAASPCALVTIGLFLAQGQEGSSLQHVARLVGLKLVVQPGLTAILAFGVFAMPPLWSHSALLLSAMPTGTGPFMLAKFYDRDAAATSQVILFSTLLSVVSISVLVTFFGHL